MGHIELCGRALDIAVRAGADEAEALIVGSRSIGVDIERGEIKTCSDVWDGGIAIRVISDGRVGLAYTNTPTSREVEKTAVQAVKASKASLRDKNWRGLPERKGYPRVRDTYDKRIVEFTSDEAVTLCQEIMDAALGVDGRVLPAFGGTGVLIQEVTCLNTNGITGEDRGTNIVCALGAMARSETQVSPVCFEFKPSRTYAPDPDWVGREAARIAIESIKVGEAEAGNFPILLDQFALQSILRHTLIPSIRGDMVHRGRSILRDKVGEEVAVEDITVYDDGTLAGGLNSGRMDMEGVPKQRTPIIERGILRGFLYDNYWARLEGKESTGNAHRGGGGLRLPPYGTMPSIYPTNMTLMPGTATEEELLREVGDGYYVRDVQGAHQSNPETGEFSVALAPAWRITDGEISHAVKGVMMAGNAYDMIKKISVLGKETRQTGTLIAPKVVVSELRVVTK
ncbi:MAG: TldD/PmbA family protein [Candidatus Bathyarchaeia archaeon]